MRVLLTTLQYLGHIVPAAVFKKALEDAGHFVHWEICAVPPITGPLERHLAQYQKEEPNQYKQLCRTLDGGYFDCLLSDPAIVAAWNIHRDRGIPWGIFGNLPIFYVDQRVPLYLQCSLPDFEPDVRVPNVKFIGPMVPTGLIEKGPRPHWSGGRRKIVYVTQGTVANTQDNLIKTTKNALQAYSQDLQVVSDYFDYCHWMGKIDVFVTNGGFSGVSQAIFHGIPMVLAGTTEDKTQVSERIAAMGCGVNLKTDNPTEEELRSAVILALRPEIKAKSLEMSAKCRFFRPEQGVSHLEDLVFNRFGLRNRKWAS